MSPPQSRIAHLVTLALLTGLLATSALAQRIEEWTIPYPDSLCSYCASWDEPQEPFLIHGDSYYVGTRGLSAILITSPVGHILIDAALPSSAPQILDNIRSLGFDPSDIELILNSHPHFDHAGGIAAIERASGARVAARPESASVIERGQVGPDDPQHGMHLAFPAAGKVERIAPGETLRVGANAVTAHATAGHTPGGTSFSWESCNGEECLSLVYADSQTPVSADGFHYTDSTTYPEAIPDFERGHDTLESLPCDILVTTHPSSTSLWERLESGDLVDSSACTRYADAAREQFERRLQRERTE